MDVNLTYGDRSEIMSLYISSYVEIDEYYFMQNLDVNSYVSYFGCWLNLIFINIINPTFGKTIDSIYDECSSHNKTISMTGKNIGNLMNEKSITWGWFEGGFKEGFPGLKTGYI